MCAGVFTTAKRKEEDCFLEKREAVEEESLAELGGKCGEGEMIMIFRTNMTN